MRAHCTLLHCRTSERIARKSSRPTPLDACVRAATLPLDPSPRSSLAGCKPHSCAAAILCMQGNFNFDPLELGCDWR
eukprot:1137859-Pelagomonas_calceolata.AAC.2